MIHLESPYRNSGLALLAGGLLAVGCASTREPGPPAARAGTAAPVQADLGDAAAAESEIRQNAALFAQAYNERDAEAVASCFTVDAEMVDEEGAVVRGRDAIRAAFLDALAAAPERRIETAIESVRVLSPGYAIEEGVAAVREAPNEAPVESRYTVIHVRRDGAWKMASVRDEPAAVEPPQGNSLGQLDWLVGDWVDEGDGYLLESSCRWNEGRSFLLRDMRLKIGGEELISLEQRIGWDPLESVVRGWVFDSAGGHAQQVWSQDEADGRWIIDSRAVGGDGSVTVMTNILAPINRDMFRWDSINRVKDGQPLPDIGTIMARRLGETKQQ